MSTNIDTLLNLTAKRTSKILNDAESQDHWMIYALAYKRVLEDLLGVEKIINFDNDIEKLQEFYKNEKRSKASSKHADILI